MSEKHIVWKLKNTEERSLAKHLKRLGNMLLRLSPDEYAILTVDCCFLQGESQHYDVNRPLDKERLREMRRFLKRNEAQLARFDVEFINFKQTDNARIRLTAEAPFTVLQLEACNIPSWLHEMTNRRFHDELGYSHRLWSYFYNRRPFKYSLSREN